MVLTDSHVDAEDDLERNIYRFQGGSLLWDVECTFKGIHVRGDNRTDDDEDLPKLINLAVKRYDQSVGAAPLAVRVLEEPESVLAFLGALSFSFCLGLVVGSVVLVVLAGEALFLFLLLLVAGRLIPDLVLQLLDDLEFFDLVLVLGLLRPAHCDSEFQVLLGRPVHLFLRSTDERDENVLYLSN